MQAKDIFTERAGDSLSELYHTNTKLNRWNARGYGERVELFNRSQEGLRAVFRQPGKLYAWAPPAALPPIAADFSANLGEVITGRRSAKSFSGREMGYQELAFILERSAGVTEPTRLLRAYPSAGAMYPLEVYVVALAVKGCEHGLYHYSVHEHSLRQIRAGDYRDRLAEVLFADGLVTTASAAVVLSAVFHRGQIKYGERSYRMVLIEAGHLAQNVLLSAAAQRTGSVPVGGFLDDELNEMLGLDGLEESALYPLLLGVP
jgi:SagB-type dehydrogenase family enzyme